MNHKQKSIRDYFLANFPDVKITLREEDHQYKFHLMIPKTCVTHLIIFDRDKFERNSLPSLFCWLRKNEQIQAIKHADSAMQIDFEDKEVNTVAGNANR